MNLSNLLEEKSKIYKNRIAIVYHNKEISYQKLNSLVIRFSNLLARIGIKEEDRVAIILPNCPEFVISYYGIIKLGAIAVILSPLYKKEELETLLDNAKVKLVITSASLVDMLKDFKIENIITDKKLHKEILKIKPKSIKKEFSKDKVAVIIYTSGTTTSPKGVMLTHSNLIANINSCIKLDIIKEKDIILSVLPLFHSYGMTVAMNIPLIMGAKIILVDKFIPQKIIRLIKKYKIEIFPGTPTMFSYILNLPGVKKEDLRTLRMCISGGMPLSDRLVQGWEGKFNSIILEGYGPTETSPIASLNPLHKRKIGSIGVPIPDVMMKVVNENGEEVEINEPGEIIIKGENVMKGYFDNPEATNKVLKNGWLYTGDIGKKDEEGYFYITGRKKEMIIVGGFKVYPEELENVLISHPKIAEVAVIGVSDLHKGEAVKCFVVPKQDERLTYEEVVEFLEEKVAHYKIPRYIEFVNELPKSETGKILKRELR